MSTSQIVALNPQIRDPDLIIPGQYVNLGGSSTDTSSSPSPSNPVVVGQTPQPVSSSTPIGSNNSEANGGITGGTSASGSGAIGFPERSTYPPVGEDAAKAGGTELGTKAEGWVDGSGNGIPDVAKGVFEVDTHTSTDPFKIQEKK